MSVLNLNSQIFRTLPRFIKFVNDALSHRNHHTEVSVVKLSFRGASIHFVAQDIVKYAYAHNVRQLTIIWSKFTSKFHEFPRCLFSSHNLKHLTIETREKCFYGKCIPISAWDFLSLETLNLSNLALSDCRFKSLDLFSKCVNLKDLTLHHCTMWDLDCFNVYAPQLCNLTITDSIAFPKVYNVVAPQLQNLTAVVNTLKDFDGSKFLHLSTEGLDSLEKVNLSLSMSHCKKEIYKLRSAKFLILDLYIIQALSSCLGQLSHEPCPFNNLKCLKQKNCWTTMPTQLKNYFLESSPNATFILDLPKVSSKRPRQKADSKDTLAKKVAKLEEEKQQTETVVEEKRILEAKVRIQDGIIAQHKAKLEVQDKVIAEQMVMKLQFEKLMSHMIDCKMAELQAQVGGGNLDYELIRSIKSIMELTPESLRVSMDAQFCCRYKEMKSMFLTQVDASRWAKIEMELGITERTTHSNNIDNSNVTAAALPLVPSSPPSSTNRMDFYLQCDKIATFSLWPSITQEALRRVGAAGMAVRGGLVVWDEQMEVDLLHDRARIIAEEDKIGNLPKEIIHRILSSLHMKYVIFP
ncbi:hypothetical protein OSB04_019768 [Centaurea solstitialis]|uniref:F-box/LRR-repeat protein 15/At3g58940/PEG3-like LRR domain-containing protein n=1 Tax=Centaurea solstitialis TaxID=347529 RepID=A0AA38T368_9ASTR|nr:hypothetical protein OSB04_019768 [Centaurea solstitialis]